MSPTKNKLIVCLFIFGTACVPNSPSVIFSSNDTGVSRIYKIDEHQGITLISLNEGKAVSPKLSPDHSKLAYLSEELGAWDIRVRDLFSAEETNITNSNNIDGPPAWAPDGKSIAFMSFQAKNRDIFVYNLESKKTSQITFNSAIDADPVWSESMQNTLYFKSLRGGNEGIFQIGLNDSLVRKISLPGGSNSKAQIIPGQNSLSYVHYSNQEFQLICFSETTNRSTLLLKSQSTISGYHWSMDGRFLALDFDDNIALYQFLDGTLMYLEEIAFGEFPQWSSTSLNLFYNLNDDQGAQIFTYNIENNTVEQVTPIAFDAYNPLPLE